MYNTTYTLKLSPQSQLTLPKNLRQQLRLKPGSRVTVVVSNDGKLKLDGKLPIQEHFGTLANTWTADDQDAAEYTRALRNSMQPDIITKV